MAPLTKVYNVRAKKSTEELSLKIDAKFKGKLTCAFKNEMRNLANKHSKFNKTFYTCLTEPSLFFRLQV